MFHVIKTLTNLWFVGTCIRNASASVVKIQNLEILGIQIKWFVEDNGKFCQFY